MKKKYRINESLLHKKNLGKHTLTDVIVQGRYSTTSYAGVFYHYTSPVGLKNILQTRTLYFSDCEYLNDYRERISINHDLDVYWRNHRAEYDKAFLSLIEKLRVGNYEDSCFSHMERSRFADEIECPSRYFILSASFNPDSLSMWKYYAKDGGYDGYCLGLATYALVDEWIDRETGVAIEEGAVVYDPLIKQDVIRDAVEKLYEQWCQYKVSDKLDSKIGNDFMSWISITSLFFKDVAFESEQEYRFVAIVPVSKLNSLSYTYNDSENKMYDFRILNGVFIPFIKMPFNYWNVDECWVVRNIRISPSSNYEQKKNGLMRFICSLEYEIPELQIFHSEIPLRH